MASSFENGGNKLSLQLRSISTGLRVAQLGALWATAAHFTVSSENAIISLPTGSGKSLVALLLPYLLQSKRVLYVVPNKILRNQIYSEFANFDLPSSLKLLPKSVKPITKKIVKQIRSINDWKALEEIEIAIGTPHVCSPAYAEIPSPPNDLFDLIIVDEAHHAPATTWEQLLESFPKTKKVLLTATPFRRDKKEVQGKLVYIYPLKRALADGILEPVEFVPADPKIKDRDLSLAQQAKKVLEKERKANNSGQLLIRADTIKEADRIAKIYQDIGLKIGTVYGAKLKQSEKNIEALREKKLDGLVCVDMLSEGFDVPSLKIAVLHSPHRSLPATLQFIGRIARTTKERTGAAKVVAQLTSDSAGKYPENELLRLYQQDANWGELIPALSKGATDNEIRKRDFFSGFAEEGLAEISSRTIRPPYRAIVYRLDKGKIDLKATPDLSTIGEVVFRSVELEERCVFWITQNENNPTWLSSDQFTTSQLQLHILVHDKSTGFIFVQTETKHLAENIITALCPEAVQLNPNELDIILSDKDVENIFNIGYANLSPQISKPVQYTTLMGRRADGGIPPGDAHFSSLGHASARVVSEDGAISEVRGAGLRSAKVWSSRVGDLFDFVDWCRQIAAMIKGANPSSVWVSPVGPMPYQLPLIIEHAEPLAMEWPQEIYENHIPLFLVNEKLGWGPVNTLELDLSVKVDPNDSDNILINTLHGGAEATISSIKLFKTSRAYINPTGSLPNDWILRQQEGFNQVDFPVYEFFNETNPQIILSNGIMVSGLIASEPQPPIYVFQKNQLFAWNWDETTITAEVNQLDDGTLNVQEATERNIINQWEKNTLVLKDHRSGEIADLIAISTESYQGYKGRIGFFHCKGSDEPKPGIRVKDIYEVAGQVVKCGKYFYFPHFFDELIRRFENGRLTIENGTEAQLRALANVSQRAFKYEFFIVQPGLSVEEINEAGEDSRLSLLAIVFQWYQNSAVTLSVIGS